MGLDQGQACQCHPVKVNHPLVLQQLLVLDGERGVSITIDPLCGSSIQHRSSELIEWRAHVLWILIAKNGVNCGTEESFLCTWRSHLKGVGQIETRELGVWHYDLSETKRMHGTDKSPRSVFDGQLPETLLEFRN